MQQLRGEHTGYAPFTLTSPFEPEMQGRCLELIVEMDLQDASADRLEIALCRSPGGEEETLVIYDCRSQELIVDCSHASRRHLLEDPIHQGLLALMPDELMSLHIFVDHSVVEVFGNGRTVITGRMYPDRVDSVGLQLRAQGGSLRIQRCDGWLLNPLIFTGSPSRAPAHDAQDRARP